MKNETSTEISVLEKLVVQGDLSKLNPQERLLYYTKVCESLNLNPLTKPFDYLQLEGKLVLYAKRDATDQLRRSNSVSITIVNREKIGDVYCVTARGTKPDGRVDEAVGVVSLLKRETVWDPDKYNHKTRQKGMRVPTGNYIPLNPDEMANAIMKAETKAKRRVTLSIIGLGMMDESELDTLPGGTERVVVDEAETTPPLESKQKQNEPSNESENASDQQGKINQKKSQTKADTPDNMQYKIVDAATGKTGRGTDYMKVVVEDTDGTKIEIYANTPETIAAITEVEGSFRMDYVSENGVNVLKSITPVQPATNSNGCVVLEKQHGKSPSGVPFAKLKVRDSEEEKIVLARDENIIKMIESVGEGTLIQFEYELQNGFKVLTSLQVLGVAA